MVGCAGWGGVVKELSNKTILQPSPVEVELWLSLAIIVHPVYNNVLVPQIMQFLCPPHPTPTEVTKPPKSGKVLASSPVNSFVWLNGRADLLGQ